MSEVGTRPLCHVKTVQRVACISTTLENAGWERSVSLAAHATTANQADLPVA
jgi:hypothetical protein